MLGPIDITYYTALMMLFIIITLFLSDTPTILESFLAYTLFVHGRVLTLVGITVSRVMVA